MKRGLSYAWFPLWIDKWLWGSTRHELSHEERAIFVDLLALAAKDDGFIRANEMTPYPIEQLAGMLQASKELVANALSKCIKYEKLSENKGIYFVNNWQEYRLSQRHKKRVIVNRTSCHSASMYKSKSKSSLSFNKNLKEWEGITEEDKKRWKEAYPACNIELELKKMIEWIISNPEKGKKSNWRRFITGWLMRQQDRGGTKGSIQEDKHKAAREGTLKQFRDGEITYEEIVEISKKYNEPLLLEEAEKIRGSKK